MNLNEKYAKLIIRPLERKNCDLRNDFYMNKFSFNRKKYKKQMEENDKLLLEYYKKFEIFINDNL